jgi:hypothetical protein
MASFAKGVALVAALAFVSGVSAQTYVESGDAGNLPATAQTATGSGTLTGIAGSTGGGDTEDMYLINIRDFSAFQAGTDPAAGSAGGSASFDTQLWLFDTSGNGILGNDDCPGGCPGFHSHLSGPTPTDGQPGLTANGNYYLAISGFGNDPNSAGGAIFNQATFAELSGPDGPGGGSPISGWMGGGATGSYTIGLSGANFVPEPATLGLVALGGLAVLRRRR